MKLKLTKKEADKKIEDFFSQEHLGSKETKKIKMLAMRHHIRIKDHRKRFCKKCCCNLSKNNIKLKKGFKAIKCSGCGYKNRWKIK